MTEVLFSINNAGKLMSARYYTITTETMEKKVLSEELIDEVIQRIIEKDRKDWKFTFDNMLFLAKMKTLLFFYKRIVQIANC